MGETNLIIQRECEKADIAFLPAAAAGTSQTCPRCGNRDPENRENQAVFICKNCRLNDNADFTASKIVRNRVFVTYFNEKATREECPTGWPEQPSQEQGRVQLFDAQGEIKPKGGATRSETPRTRDRNPKPTSTQLALQLVAKEDVYVSQN